MLRRFPSRGQILRQGSALEMRSVSPLMCYVSYAYNIFQWMLDIMHHSDYDAPDAVGPA